MTHRDIVCATVLAAAPWAASPHAQSASPVTSTDVASPVETSDPTLHARLDTIGRRSGLWRAALQALHGTGRRVVVLTPDQVSVAETPADLQRDRFDEGVVAAAAPLPEQGTRVRTVLVVINLPLLERLHGRRNSLPGELYVDLDRLLVHEVYGHAFPYLIAGDLSGRCADPVRGQAPVDACAISRENAVREELGLGRRTTYGLQDLLLTFASR